MVFKGGEKARIDDDELCAAIVQVTRGQAIDLGGGVFKKCLNNNRHRSIILSRGKGYWVYEYLFAKKDRENIDDDELKAFPKLAKVYEALTQIQLEALIDDKDLVEICAEIST